GVEIAKRLIEGVPHLDGLAEELTSDDDTRFAALESLVAEQDVDAALISAPPNFSEVVARPVSDAQVALWTAYDQKLYVLAPESSHGVIGTPVGRFCSLGAGVLGLSRGNRIGVEEDWIHTGLALELESEGGSLEPFSRQLGHWRDIRD